MHDFIPISLVHSIYKLLSKVLARRLKRTLPLILVLFRGPLFGNKQILDGVLIVNNLPIPENAPTNKVLSSR